MPCALPCSISDTI